MISGSLSTVFIVFAKNTHRHTDTHTVILTGDVIKESEDSRMAKQPRD